MWFQWDSFRGADVSCFPLFYAPSLQRATALRWRPLAPAPLRCLSPESWSPVLSDKEQKLVEAQVGTQDEMLQRRDSQHRPRSGTQQIRQPFARRAREQGQSLTGRESQTQDDGKDFVQTPSASLLPAPLRDLLEYTLPVCCSSRCLSAPCSRGGPLVSGPDRDLVELSDLGPGQPQARCSPRPGSSTSAAGHRAAAS